jgi:hypothetical protein
MIQLMLLMLLHGGEASHDSGNELLNGGKTLHDSGNIITWRKSESQFR